MAEQMENIAQILNSIFHGAHSYQQTLTYLFTRLQKKIPWYIKKETSIYWELHQSYCVAHESNQMFAIVVWK